MIVSLFAGIPEPVCAAVADVLLSLPIFKYATCFVRVKQGLSIS